MNYNANFGGRPPGPGSRKIKRVSDVNAMGAPAAVPFVDPQQQIPPQSYGGGGGMPYDQNYGNVQYPNLQQQQIPQQQYANSGYSDFNQQIPPQPQSHQNIPPQQQQFGMFPQPIVQDMAMQYGQRLADQGKQLVESQFEKYVPVTRLKYYFSVDNKYVINKLRLLFFPFTHTDWSLKYDQDNPVQPRYDINAPDLYIPTMAYITYVVLAGFVLGIQNRFSPEQLGILASSALAYTIFEMIIYTLTLYITNISTTLRTLDLLAYSGYKFIIICSCILISILFQRVGYYSALVYCSLSLSFFLLRTLKAKVLQDKSQNESSYSNQPYNNVPGAGPPTQQLDYSAGRKRKLYFLFLVTGLQPLLAFWLSMHLIPNKIDVANAVKF